MTPRRSGIVSAFLGTLIGPAAAGLYESGRLDLFQAMPLLNVWVVVVCGGFGLWAGVRSVRRGVVIPGSLCLLANVAVCALYGFLATFFGLGGSR